MSEPLDLEPIKAALNDQRLGNRQIIRPLLAEVERLRGEVARQAEQITAVRAACDRWGTNYAPVREIRAALGDKPPLPPPNPLLTATVDDTPLVPLDGTS